MKKLKAIIDARTVDRICAMLIDSNTTDFTITECAAPDANVPYVHSFRTENLSPDLTPISLLEVIVASDQVDAVISLIENNGGIEDARSGRLQVLPIDTAIRIRNGEFGDDALN